MKILVVTQRFFPENFRINDIVKQLVQRGHEVTVLCGLPNYPEGHIYKGYEKAYKRCESFEGATVIRVREIPRRNNILFRFLNYYSFAIFGKRKIKSLDDNFDVVFVNQLSPIMMVEPALKYKKSHDCKVLMYEMDLWPESLLAGGISKKTLLYKHYLKVSKKIYSNTDLILTSSQGHVPYIEKLTSMKNVKLLPQYAEEEYMTIPNLSINNERFTFVFTGNIGKAQNLDKLIFAIDKMSNDEVNKFHVIIVGDGSEKPRLERSVRDKEIGNVEFVGKKSLNDTLHYYAIANVMVVSLEDSEYARLTLPGKVQSYMAAGKPILSFASGETNELIKQVGCGLISDSNNVSALADNIRKFLNKDDDELEIMGTRSREYSTRNFQKDKFLDCIELELHKLIKK